MIVSVTLPTGAHGRSPSADTEMALREQAIAAVKRRRKFWDDLALYVGVNGVLWLVWALADRSTDGWVPWPTWVSAIWGFLLLLDGIKAFARWPGNGPVSEAEIERELSRRHRA